MVDLAGSGARAPESGSKRCLRRCAAWSRGGYASTPDRAPAPTLPMWRPPASWGASSSSAASAWSTEALTSGGEAIGVLPRALERRELAHRGLTELHLVDSMHERKLLMSELAGAFVALPGGLGTLDEVAEALTWTQLGLQAKPVGLLDVRGYWDEL